MQLTTLPPTVLAANHDVLGAMRGAAQDARAALAVVDAPAFDAGDARLLVGSALAQASEAHEGVAALGAANLLDGTFQRYATHAVRHLSQAAGLLARPELSKDARAILAGAVHDAEVSTRLATEAGERSTAKPTPTALERATEFSTGAGDSGPAWVDGAWLDSLGNPVRQGGDTGPDGTGSGWDGSGERSDGSGYTGPDGVTYDGI